MLTYVGSKEMSDYGADDFCGRLAPDWMLKAAKPRTLGFQHLFMTKVRNVPEGIFLPYLIKLKLRFPLDDFQWDNERLLTVSELHLLDTTVEKCIQILKQCGPQLTKLVIILEYQNIPVDQVLTLCPNLNKLKLSVDCTPEYIIYGSAINMRALQHLTELELIAELNLETDYLLACPGMLVQLLQAPELRKLNLTWLPLGHLDLIAIIQMIQLRRILQKLEFVSLRPWHKRESECYKMELEQIDKVEDSMFWNCPNLRYHLSFGKLCLVGWRMGG